MTHASAFKVLGLAPGASLAAIRAAHDQLLAQWHPDRHAHTPQSAALAATRRTELAAALALFAPQPAVHAADAGHASPSPSPYAPQAAPAQPYSPHPTPLPLPGPAFPAPAELPRSHRRSLGIRNICVGAALLLVGILVTVGTREAAAGSGGGTYLIMYGPMIGGALLVFQGIGQLASS